MKWIHPECWERSNRRCIPCRHNVPPPDEDVNTIQMMFESIIPAANLPYRGDGVLNLLTPLITAVSTPLVNDLLSQIEQQGAARLRLANRWSAILGSRALKIFTIILMTYFVIYLTMRLLIMARVTYTIMFH